MTQDFLVKGFGYLIFNYLSALGPLCGTALDHFHYLERVARKGGQKIVVVGGGFLGTTLTAALAEMNRADPALENTIVQTFVESSPAAAVLPGLLV
jgi:hypothetical protein